MKSKEEQHALKEKAETEPKNPRKLTEEELEKVAGGIPGLFECDNSGYMPDVVGQGDCPNPQCAFHSSCTNVYFIQTNGPRFVCFACGTEVDVSSIDFSYTALHDQAFSNLRKYLGLE